MKKFFSKIKTSFKESWQLLTVSGGAVALNAVGSTTLVNQAPMSMTEGISVFENFVGMLWGYITTAVAWILTPAMWILLVPFLAYMSVIAASVLKSLVKGA